MRLSLLYNPVVIIERLGDKRKSKVNTTPAARLGTGYLDSLELLELIRTGRHNIKVVFDGGVNIGTWTILAKSLFPVAMIHAFEPLSSHIELFKKNTKALMDVQIHPFCLRGVKTQVLLLIYQVFPTRPAY